jgi:hypothetical protein
MLMLSVACGRDLSADGDEAIAEIAEEVRVGIAKLRGEAMSENASVRDEVEAFRADIRNSSRRWTFTMVMVIVAWGAFLLYAITMCGS